MGTYDRDYMRREPRGSSAWSGPERIVWVFLGLSVLVYLLPTLTGWGYQDGERLGRFTSGSLRRGEIWTLFTYQFVHGNLLHLLMNMLGLYFIGRLVASQLGAVQFAAIYLLGGVAGALFETVLTAVTVGRPIAMVGASASVSALLCVFVTIAPGLPVRVFPFPFTFTLARLAWIYIGFNAVLGLVSLGSASTGVAYLAHVGGALYGILHGRHFRQRIVLPTVRFRRAGPKGSERSTVSYRPRSGQPNVIDADFQGKGRGPGGKTPRNYDEVLDKINREGIGSLTPEERKILEEASQNLGRRED
jgi:membrane associated rhomboid family serine protease